MAKLGKMPQKEIIDGFKGLIDFYYWKGIPVARRWPRYFPRTPSPAEAAIQTAFAYINRLWGDLPLLVLVQLTLFAARSTLTGKDFLVRGYIKGLYDLMPPEYYATEATLLLLLAQLDVALSTRALEAGGNLADIKTAVELIDDLRKALHSVGQDELDVTVEGYDPVPSFPVVHSAQNINVPNATVQTVLTYTVPGSKTFYLTDWNLHEFTTAAGTEFIGYLDIAGTRRWFSRAPAGHSISVHFSTPLQATTGQAIKIDCYQFSGGAVAYAASLIGFGV